MLFQSPDAPHGATIVIELHPDPGHTTISSTIRDGSGGLWDGAYERMKGDYEAEELAAVVLRLVETWQRGRTAQYRRIIRRMLIRR